MSRADRSRHSTRNRQAFLRKLRFEQVEDRRMLAPLPYQFAADPYDVNADGKSDGTDVYLEDSELKANGERSLSNPNGPVDHFWDVNGDRALTYDDLDLLLRFQTNTIQPELPKSGGKSTGSTSGGVSTMTVYTVTLTSPGNVNEGSSFPLYGIVSPAPPPMTWFQPAVNWGATPGNTLPPMQVLIGPGGTFSVSHIYYDDGPAPGNGQTPDNDTITLSGTIMGSPVSAQTGVTIHNVAPVPQLQLINTNQPNGGPRWQVSGTIQDVGSAD